MKNLLIIALLCFAIGLMGLYLGFRAGWAARDAYAHPEVDLVEHTIGGELYHCPPRHCSRIVPEGFTRLDTVGELVAVWRGDTLLGYYKSR